VKKEKPKASPKLSLKGVKFEDALRAMLQTPPEKDSKKGKRINGD
jgi:hypothetical protein